MLKKKYFLSCWVCDEKEMIPQWAMYAPKGVRIELPVNWYKKHLIPIEGSDQFTDKIPLDDSHPCKDTFFPLPFSEWFKNEQKFYLIPPLDEKDGFMLKVEYNENFSHLKRQRWSELENKDGISLLNLSDPIKYKDSYWSFQREFRYFLLSSCKHEDEDKLPEFIDVPIDEKALKQIKIRLYPNCEERELAEVFDVLSIKFPTLDSSQHIERSQLDGKYRPKE